MSKPSVYLKLEMKIAADESGGIKHRWEYGRELLKARVGRQRLPKGYLADRIAEAAKAGLPALSEQEMQRRMKFAEVYPTEAHKRQILTLMGSWSAIINAGFPEVTVDETEALLDAIENGPRPERLEFEQLGMFPEIVKSIPLAEATLRHLIAYAEEMAAMTASYARRDAERREHLNALTAAVGGDLDATYPEAVTALAALDHLADVAT